MNDEIQNLLDAYQRGLNEGDPVLIRSVYADDAIFIGQPFPTATGIDEIIALYSDFLSTLDFDVRFEVQEVDLSGDLGFVRTRSHGTITPKGQRLQRRGLTEKSTAGGAVARAGCQAKATRARG